MAKFKLKKGVKIGALAAENDELLNKVFIDQGHLDRLLNTEDNAFLILGRTGSGKTALIEQLKKKVVHVSELDPEALSLHYLHNSVLRVISSWDINLEMFYKYLWRHVCILELIRMRYGDAEDVPSRIQQIFPLANLFKGDRQRAREFSQQYLKEYGDDYWVKTDTRIKKITSEMEDRFRSDELLAARLGISNGASSQPIASGERVEPEIADRVQKIVADFQIAALNRVVEALAQYGFDDDQKKYFIVIDNLDRDWITDDVLYLNLIKSLLFTVQELNRKLKNVKIIVSLRENIYYRVFLKAGKHEPQREKWEDVQVRLTWSESELLEMVDSRLAEVFRGEYTQEPPHLTSLLPLPKKKNQESASDFILSRTFLRPRDLIDFLNRCFDVSESLSRISWSTLEKIEVEYSESRLKYAFDEWRDSFYGIPATYPVIRRLGSKFVLKDISDDDVYAILEHARCNDCEWLGELSIKHFNHSMSLADVKVEIVKALYLVGILGLKHPTSHRIFYSFDRGLSTQDLVPDAELQVHKMFRTALGIFANNEPVASTEVGHK
jgi:hypothetical protein